jgi:hypothetical protein
LITLHRYEQTTMKIKLLDALNAADNDEGDGHPLVRPRVAGPLYKGIRGLCAHVLRRADNSQITVRQQAKDMLPLPEES